MKPAWRRLIKTLVAIALFFCALVPASAAENLRYLLLVDHSPEMATRQIPTVQTIYDIIRGGFAGQIQPGEHFAIWFYGSRLQTNAPFTWQPGRETEIARQAAGLFTGRIYSRLRPREQTLVDAAPFIAAAPKITIFIFTDGSQSLAGTPFDAEINNAVANNQIAFMRTDRPFVITLLARNGNLVNGTIHTNISAPFEIPEFDRRNETMEKALATMRSAVAPPTQKAADPAEIQKALDAIRNAPTTAPQRSAAAAEDARAAVRDALAGKPAKETPIPVESLRIGSSLQDAPKEQPKPLPQETKTEPSSKIPALLQRPVEVAAAPPQANPEKAAEPKPIVKQEPANVEQPKPIVREEPKTIAPPSPPIVPESKPPTEVARPAIREEPKTTVVETPKAPPQQVAVIPTNTPPQTKAVDQPKPLSTNTAPVKAEPRKSLPPTPAQLATVTARPRRFPWPALVVGLAVIGVIGAFALLRARRRAKSAGSLITQALPPHTNIRPPH